MERIPRPVDDGLQQLVPGARGRRQSRDLVQEAKLFELVGSGERLDRVLRPWGPSSSRYKGRKGCGHRRLRSLSSLGCGWARPDRPSVSAAMTSDRTERAPNPPGSARPAPATRWPARSGCWARSWARSSSSRRARRPTRPSSGSAGEPSRCAASTTRLERERQAADLDALDLGATEAVVAAFSIYFQLVNLAEARGRVRTLRRRERAARDGLLDDSVAEAVDHLRRAGHGEAELDAMLAAAAHQPGPDRPPDRGAPPDRAGRAAALRGPARTARRSAPHARRRIARSGAGCARRSRSCGGPRTCGRSRPEPLDEVRTAMAVFDATLFTTVPRLYRATDAALDAPRGRAVRTGARPPRVPAFVRYGSWIGGDRDGNPFVTAETTERTAAHPGRPRHPRLRGRRDAAHADRVRRDVG